MKLKKERVYSNWYGFLDAKDGYFFTEEEFNKYVTNLLNKAIDIVKQHASVEFIDLQTNEVFDYTDVLVDEKILAQVSVGSIDEAFKELKDEFISQKLESHE